MGRAPVTSLADLPRWGTEAEYLELDERSPYPLEYYGSRDHPGWGEIVVRGGGTLAMAGGSDEHSLITANISGELRTRVRTQACRVYSPDKRIVNAHDPTYAYPDVSVICGEAGTASTSGGRPIDHPRLIVEVLSPSTERNDRGPKFERYFRSASLQEYVLAAQDQPRLESYYRQPDGTWSFSYAVGLDATLRLRSLGIDLPLAEVYLHMSFPAAPGPTTPAGGSGTGPTGG